MMVTTLRRFWCCQTLFYPKLTRSLRYLPTEEHRSLEQRLKELDVSDPELNKPIDIGFPSPYRISTKLTREQRNFLEERKTKELELASRHRTIQVPLEEVREQWLHSNGPSHIKTIASHYGIYRDLFDNAHFYPWVSLNVLYNFNENFSTPVYHGNHVKPCEATSPPVVNYDAESDSLWTLLLTNLDCHYEDSSKEYLHWFVANIPGNQIEKGNVVCDYLQPFPAKGTGFHRFVFVLYKQNKKLDFTSQQRPQPCFSLKERTFKTYDFYKENEDHLTPAGLAFFQSDWDESLTDFFHNILKMKEPIFEYDFPDIYINPQVWNPHIVAFDDYLDMYRDPKEVAEEVLQMRLKNLNPFEREPPLPKFPLIFGIPKGTPSWLKKQMQRQLLRTGKYREL